MALGDRRAARGEISIGGGDDQIRVGEREEMSENTGELFAIALLVSAVVGAIIGAEKGNAGKGALLGFLLGPFGWILAMMDVGFIGMFIVAAVIGSVLYLGIRASEQDRDRMEKLKIEARQKTGADDVK